MGYRNTMMVKRDVKRLVITKTWRTRVRKALLTPDSSILVKRYRRDARLLKRRPAVRNGKRPVAKTMETVFAE